MPIITTSRSLLFRVIAPTDFTMRAVPVGNDIRYYIDRNPLVEVIRQDDRDHLSRKERDDGS